MAVTSASPSHAGLRAFTAPLVTISVTVHSNVQSGPNGSTDNCIQTHSTDDSVSSTFECGKRNWLSRMLALASELVATLLALQALKQPQQQPPTRP